MENQMLRQMLFASAITTEHDPDKASRLLATQIEGQIAGRSLDLALLFLSPHFRVTAMDIVTNLQEAFKPKVLIGCTGEGVIGREREIERRPAIALVAAHLPGIELAPFKLQSMDWERRLDDVETVRHMIAAPPETKLFMLLADPFTTPMDAVLDAFNSSYPGLPMIGGLASGSHRAGGNALLLNNRIVNNGAVGVAFAGEFEVDIIVSQGCRPIGRPLKVTAVRENIVFSLEGKTPLERIKVLVTELEAEDQELLQNGLFLGRAIDSSQETLGRGDFLIRGVMGLDQQSGAMIISDYLDEGETVQFHVRDAITAEEDLEMMLTPQIFFEPPSGGMLFSCNGRGTRLYNHPNGDISTIQKVIGNIDLAGFFCAGEIGPIGGKNFLHGHTASLALFRPMSS